MDASFNFVTIQQSHSILGNTLQPSTGMTFSSFVHCIMLWVHIIMHISIIKLPYFFFFSTNLIHHKEILENKLGLIQIPTHNYYKNNTITTINYWLRTVNSWSNSACQNCYIHQNNYYGYNCWVSSFNQLTSGSFVVVGRWE